MRIALYQRLLAPKRVKSYEDKITRICAETRDELDLHSVTVLNLNLPSTPDEGISLSHVTAEAILPDSADACFRCYRFRVFWALESLRLELNAKAKKKLGMRPQIRIGVRDVKFEGVVRLRTNVTGFEPFEIAFLEQPSVDFTVESKLKMGKLTLKSFQQTVEAKITNKLRKAITKFVDRKMMGKNWLPLSRRVRKPKDGALSTFESKDLSDSSYTIDDSSSRFSVSATAAHTLAPSTPTAKSQNATLDTPSPLELPNSTTDLKVQRPSDSKHTQSPELISPRKKPAPPPPKLSG